MVSVSLTSTYKATKPIQNVVIITSDPSKTPVLAAKVEKAFCKILEWCAISKPDWFDLIVPSLKSSGESVNTSQFHLPSTQTPGTFVKLSASVLPSVSSRHNTLTRSHAVANAVKTNKSSNGDTLVVIVPESADQAFAQACAAGRQFPVFSMKTSTGGEPSSADIVIDLTEIEAAAAGQPTELTTSVSNTVNNIQLAQRLVDMPPNLLHTDSYVDEAKNVAALLGCDIKVIQGNDLRDGGFGGLWGVGKASNHLPALAILSYYPPGTNKDTDKSICLVGKGIVYDTGGLSIKTPTTSMAGMKVDMGGSAAVLGAFAATVSNTKAGGSLKAPLHALLCIAENSVSDRSTRPDDILTMLSGKTVEVNNVDAEGRLVLADGCFYASKYLNPSHIIDIATLTGAQLIATGRFVASLYCNDDHLEAAAVTVGRETGDLAHPVPYIPEFWKTEFKSVVADMKNSVKDRGNAQVSCAGQFVGNHIEGFTSDGGKWLHVDMAGPASAEERATGFGVALLSQLVHKLNA